MRKLVIKNQTKWDTRALRSVFLRVINENIRFEGPLRHTIRVKVVHSRTGHMSGWAVLHSGNMRLRLPKPDRGVLDVRKLAHLLEHELAHCRGYQHAGMCGLNGWHVREDDYKYLDGLTVHAKQAKPKPVIDYKRVRYDRVLKQIAAWQSKAKRAENSLRKLRKKAAYYERTCDTSKA